VMLNDPIVARRIKRLSVTQFNKS